MGTKSVLKFVDTVIQHFPPFRWDEEQEKAWVGTMVKELGGFSDKVLDNAITTMIRTRKDRKIPLVSECIDACLDARRWLEAEARKGELPVLGSEPAGGEWSAERQRLAYEICRATQVGKRAAKEGWILSLWDFVRKNQRAPTTEHEIAACKKAAREFDETYAKCVKGGWPEAGHWAKVGEGMLNKRERLRAEALGR